MKPVVYYLHGLFSASWMQHFLPLKRAIESTGLELVIPEHVGHGIHPADESPWQVYDTLDALNKRIRAEHRPVILIGHSMGGAIALSAAFMNKRKVIAAIGIAAPNGRTASKPAQLAKLSKLFNTDFQHMDPLLFRQILQVMPIVNFKGDPARMPRVYLVHSKNDEVVPFTEFKENVAMIVVPEERTLVLDKASGNGNFDHFLTAYDKRTRDFVVAALGAEKAAARVR